MIQPNEPVYKRFEIVTEQVKTNLKKRGVAIPFENGDGSLTIGNYTIVKKDIFYQIVNRYNEIVIDKINLPQTAAILANDLAVGKFIDNNILNLDRLYGFADFEERLYSTRNSKRNSSQTELRAIKSKIKNLQKVAAKKEIMNHFEKLRRFV